MKDNLTENELKKQARIAREYLESCGIGINQSQALETLARVHGWRNWATARAKFKPSIVEHTAEHTKAWVDRVLWLGFWWEDDCDDRWYAFPCGTDPDNLPQGLGSLRRLPAYFRFTPANTRLSEIYAELPAIDKYGVPREAREQAAEVFSAAGLGIAKEGICVDVHDRRDDSGTSYWLRVQMPKHVSDALDMAAQSHFVESAASLVREQAVNTGIAITRETLERVAREQCKTWKLGTPSEQELAALRQEFGH